MPSLLLSLGPELIDDFAAAVEERQARGSIRSDLHHDSRSSAAIHERDARRALLVVPDEHPAAPPVVGVGHDQPDDVVGSIVDAGELDDLAAGVAIEHEAGAGIDDFSLGVSMSADDQPMGLFG